MWSLFMVAACVALIARGFRWIERVDPAPPVDEPAGEVAPSPVESGSLA
jgi:hypothetical protein